MTPAEYLAACVLEGRAVDAAPLAARLIDDAMRLVPGLHVPTVAIGDDPIVGVTWRRGGTIVSVEVEPDGTASWFCGSGDLSDAVGVDVPSTSIRSEQLGWLQRVAEPRDPYDANPGARPMPHPGAPRD